MASNLIHILEDKGALYQPYMQENPVWVLRSLEDLRRTLTGIRSKIDSQSPLSVIVDSMIRACRHYMNTTPEFPDIAELNFSLGAVRKVIGINVGDLRKHYHLPVSHELLSIIPD
ncbi:hypothetical protein [Microvirgula aerodenitrificans]|uniref:hypothetical protein n=1 Tax=Microvirgula aerodenitrificans TaxID=57480 RepID=UPI0028F07AC8|nr:hypothetical protein [Microvirgula aerodenitrificans]